MVDPVGVGISILGLIQVASMFQSGRNNKQIVDKVDSLSNKVDAKVSDSRCGERRKACSRENQQACEALKKTSDILEKKMDHHCHNGGGAVKYGPIT
jgi:hypothetical protein